MKKFAIGLIILGIGFAFPVQAQKMKLGFVESEYILGLMPEAQAAQRDVDAFERKLVNRITAMRQGLEYQAARLEQEAPNLSDSVRAVQEQELRTLQQDIRQEQQTAQQQLQFKVIQSLSPLRQRVQQVIDSVAQANGYTLILPTTLDNGQPTLIYARKPKEADLNPLVIKALGLTPPADPTGQ